MTTTTTVSSSFGEAYIAVKRNRVKHLNTDVYLQNKQEFELELFNPSQITKVAKISINGKPISTSGIVLKPGQRVFLERYLDNSKKFLFETYTVEGDNAQVEKAIANNGTVRVDFYDEVSTPIYYNAFPQNINTMFNSTRSSPVDPSYSTSNFLNSTTRGGAGGASCDSMSDMSMSFMSESLGEKMRCSSASIGQRESSVGARGIKRLASKETGRVEQGSTSAQRFSSYSGNFNSWISNYVIIKLLPVSQKPLEASDLAVYCTNCGSKNKSGKYKFCPTCGNKFGE